jgi:hypothetical protein
VASPDAVQTLDRASFDRFRAELARAGFHSTDGGRTWTGPVAEPLKAYTTAPRMTITIRDGWPYVQPDLQVDGMKPLEHVNAGGSVCLWQQGDVSRQWETFQGWQDRIAEWCARQSDGFMRVDVTMDAHAYFEGAVHALARMDLATIRPDTPDGDRGPVHGRWRNSGALLDLSVERAGGQELKGSWFYRQAISAPPRDLRELRVLLSARQQESLDGLIKAAREGKERVIVLAWDAKDARNALVLLLDQDPDSTPTRRGRRGKTVGDKLRARGRALEFAPADATVLQSRAGHDAARLSGYGVLILGAGAVGSHAALLLAECGVGELTLVDAERLRPGNVVRHIAPASAVGLHKVQAVSQVIAQHAPWTKVTKHVESPWGPERLRALMADHDLVLDVTGSAGFADQISRLATDADETLVTATLYRGGSIARICRQGPGDTALIERDDPEFYPAIPHGTETEQVQLEPGCSAPVNQASPHAVAACAALAVEIVLDALPGPAQVPDEICEVYRPLEWAPFDRVGRTSSA